ncbi:MAG: hypothetical protein QXH91_04380, partial [Candidatus Bathyarchaeia archaeon]
MYNVLQFDPANQTVRLIYVKPDNDYYFNFLFGKKVFVPEVIDYELRGNEWIPKVIATNVTLEFPLLPLNNGTRMKEWFPSREDRMLIYACQYHRKFTEFNAKTGEDRWPGSTDKPWSVEYGRKTLFDDLELVWEGGKWGRFEGKLFDRIIKAYSDKEWKSYPMKIVYGNDHEEARYGYLSRLDPSLKVSYGDFITKFIKDVDAKLAQDVITDLGFRFTDGLSSVDTAAMKIPHQYIPQRDSLYAKALGYAMFEILAKAPEGPYWHEAPAGVAPKNLFNELGSIRTFGQIIHPYVYLNES